MQRQNVYHRRMVNFNRDAKNARFQGKTRSNLRKMNFDVWRTAMSKLNELTPFGRQVKLRLLEVGMDARELADRVGTSPVQISRILHGTRPGRKQIPKIARELNIDMDKATTN